MSHRFSPLALALATLTGCGCESSIHTVYDSIIYVTAGRIPAGQEVTTASGIDASSWFAVDNENIVMPLDVDVETVGHYCDFEFSLGNRLSGLEPGDYRAVLLSQPLLWPLTPELTQQLTLWDGQQAIVTDFTIDP